jgi:hypothetical protein
MVINTGNHIAARAAMPASVGATGMLAVHLMGRAWDTPGSAMRAFPYGPHCRKTYRMVR